MENFDNDECWKSVKFVNIFPHQYVALYGIVIFGLVGFLFVCLNRWCPTTDCLLFQTPFCLSCVSDSDIAKYSCGTNWPTFTNITTTMM